MANKNYSKETLAILQSHVLKLAPYIYISVIEFDTRRRIREVIGMKIHMMAHARATYFTNNCCVIIYICCRFTFITTLPEQSQRFATNFPRIQDLSCITKERKFYDIAKFTRTSKL